MKIILKKIQAYTRKLYLGYKRSPICFYYLAISNILLYFMRYRQSEKDIDKLKDSVDKKERRRLEFSETIPAQQRRNGANPVRVDEKLAVSQQQIKSHHYDG